MPDFKHASTADTLNDRLRQIDDEAREADIISQYYRRHHDDETADKYAARYEALVHIVVTMTADNPDCDKLANLTGDDLKAAIAWGPEPATDSVKSAPPKANWFYPLFATCAVCGERLQFDIDPNGTPGQNGDWGANGDYGCITGDDEGSDGHTPTNIRWGREEPATDSAKLVRIRFEATSLDDGDIFLHWLASHGVISDADYRANKWFPRNDVVDIPASRVAEIKDLPGSLGVEVEIWDDEPATNSVKRQRLAELEAEFEAAGGRGVELAEEIDALRTELARWTIIDANNSFHESQGLTESSLRSQLRRLGYEVDDDLPIEDVIDRLDHEHEGLSIEPVDNEPTTDSVREAATFEERLAAVRARARYMGVNTIDMTDLLTVEIGEQEEDVVITMETAEHLYQQLGFLLGHEGDS